MDALRLVEASDTLCDLINSRTNTQLQQQVDENGNNVLKEILKKPGLTVIAPDNHTRHAFNLLYTRLAAANPNRIVFQIKGSITRPRDRRRTRERVAICDKDVFRLGGEPETTTELPAILELFVGMEMRVKTNQSKYPNHVVAHIEQYPMVPAFAMTVHGVQGVTKNAIALADPRPAGMERLISGASLYVALSRLRRSKYLWVLQPIPRAVLKSMKPDPLAVAEDERLQMLDELTKTAFDQVTAIAPGDPRIAKLFDDAILFSRQHAAEKLVAKRASDALNASVKVKQARLKLGDENMVLDGFFAHGGKPATLFGAAASPSPTSARNSAPSAAAAVLAVTPAAARSQTAFREQEELDLAIALSLAEADGAARGQPPHYWSASHAPASRSTAAAAQPAKFVVEKRISPAAVPASVSVSVSVSASKQDDLGLAAAISASFAKLNLRNGSVGACRPYDAADHLLTEEELTVVGNFKVWRKPNPRKNTYHDMYLYLRGEIEKYAIEKWGSLDAMDAEYARREDDKVKRKEAKFKKKLAQLRNATRTSLWAEQEEAHVHVFKPAEGKETVPPMRLVATNLRLLRCPDAEQLNDHSFASTANSKLSDALFVFLFTLVNRTRALKEFRTIYPPADHAARRDFRGVVCAWLEELKPHLVGVTWVRRSVLDEGRGDRFIELLLGLSTHALRVHLALLAPDSARRVAGLVSDDADVPPEAHIATLSAAYRSKVAEHLDAQATWQQYSSELESTLHSLDSEIAELQARGASRASGPDIHGSLLAAHTELVQLWNQLAQVPWVQSRDLVSSLIEDIPLVLEPDFVSSAIGNSVDWTRWRPLASVVDELTRPAPPSRNRRRSSSLAWTVSALGPQPPHSQRLFSPLRNGVAATPSDSFVSSDTSQVRRSHRTQHRSSNDTSLADVEQQIVAQLLSDDPTIAESGDESAPALIIAMTPLTSRAAPAIPHTPASAAPHTNGARPRPSPGFTPSSAGPHAKRRRLSYAGAFATTPGSADHRRISLSPAVRKLLGSGWQDLDGTPVRAAASRRSRRSAAAMEAIMSDHEDDDGENGGGAGDVSVDFGLIGEVEDLQKVDLLGTLFDDEADGGEHGREI
ncbi:DNA repair protein rad14 [Blastocladiella emersonii ATCC 22665]|nr:DNA repair protein rad14 [Blastocladiella emersonii ATCC 22665]